MEPNDLFSPLPASDPLALAVKLCGGKPDAWARALDATGSVRALLTAPAPTLAAAGLSTAAVERLGLVRDMVAAYGETPLRRGDQFSDSAVVWAHFRERLASPTQPERFILLCLDTRHKLLSERVVAIGSLSASIVHPRDILRHALIDCAAAVVFVHNHPSGDPRPSPEDITITRRLREACELLGIRALDHIIIGAGRYVSFVDDGYWGSTGA